MIAEIENIISRIGIDEAAMLSRSELAEILQQLKDYKALQSKYALLVTQKSI